MGRGKRIEVRVSENGRMKLKGRAGSTMFVVGKKTELQNICPQIYNITRKILINQIYASENVATI